MISLKQRRRARLRAMPVSAAWLVIIERNVPLFSRLDDADKAELLGHVQVFVAEKLWEGCAGLELTDEIRVTIATQACMLLLHRDTDYYPKVKVILVYPSSYVSTGERSVGGGLWTEAEEHMLGHTQQQLGAIVLAWDSALHGSRVFDDGHNLVLHEFAHQLDFEGTGTDGTPSLDTRQQYLSWARVLGAEYEELRRLDDAGEPSFLDGYGATNPAEFFAVVTEFFFERAVELKAKHPALYEELKAFYRQNPASIVESRN